MGEVDARGAQAVGDPEAVGDAEEAAASVHGGSPRMLRFAHRTPTPLLMGNRPSTRPAPAARNGCTVRRTNEGNTRDIA